MPKKSVSPRGGPQRNKPKVQKSFELVRPEADVSEISGTADVASVAPVSATVATPEKPSEELPESKSSQEIPKLTSPDGAMKNLAVSASSQEIHKSPSSGGTMKNLAVPKSGKQPAPIVAEQQVDGEAALPKGSAAARMAARRRAAHKSQQRSAVSLITAEHFAYVRRDLITIAVLACIMFTAIIVLYVTIGRS
jgi:hypothetical protein